MTNSEARGIIEALEEGGPAVRIRGHVGKQDDSAALRIYPALDTRSFYEVDPNDVIHRVEGGEPTTPSSFFIKENAEVKYVARMKALSVVQPTFGHECEGDLDCCLQYGNDVYTDCINMGLGDRYCRALRDYWVSLCNRSPNPPPIYPEGPASPRSRPI